MKKGFTLIELLVVVLIIGILASIGIPQYFKAVERSRVTEATNAFANIKNAQERFFSRMNSYTNNWDDIDITMKNVGGNGADCSGIGACVLKNYNVQITANTQTSYVISATRRDNVNRYGAYTINFTGPVGTLSCSNNYCARELLQ
jgi:prepilin-type N-terminal cleavage/methylation domain-containing protein